MGQARGSSRAVRTGLANPAMVHKGPCRLGVERSWRHWGRDDIRFLQIVPDGFVRAGHGAGLVVMTSLSDYDQALRVWDWRPPSSP